MSPPPGVETFKRINVRLESMYTKLQASSVADPRALAQFLSAMVENSLGDEAADRVEQLQTTGEFNGRDLRPLLALHSYGPVTTSLFHDYLNAAIGNDLGAERRLEKAATSSTPPPLAAEMLGYLRTQQGNTSAAAALFYQEGTQFPDAANARARAVAEALKDEDRILLHSIAEQPGWLEGCPPNLQLDAAYLLNDVGQQWKLRTRAYLSHFPYELLGLTLLASGLWYFILVDHGPRDRWRWIRPLAAVAAGIASIWPTLSLAAWQEHAQGLKEGGTFPQDLMYYLVGVGLREEVCKLALFALFLPWLLWRKQPGLALLTGAFVGLGFALEENINYYQTSPSLVVGRFVTANFMHVAMTGVCAHGLYEMMRTRFARADYFLACFVSMVAAHGFYDWLPTQPDLSFLSIVVLVVTVLRFFDLLAQETRPFRLTISPRAVFAVGFALLVALAFVLGALTGEGMSGVSSAGLSCVGTVPIAILYWRKFEHS